MSFQAAEKALKAMQYNVDANQKTNDHNLCQNCYDFDDHGLPQLAGQLEGLVVNSAHMRYQKWRVYSRKGREGPGLSKRHSGESESRIDLVKGMCDITLIFCSPEIRLYGLRREWDGWWNQTTPADFKIR